MSWFSRLLGEFTHASGLFPAPMHDVDLLDEPGGTWPPDPVSRQELRALRSDTEASTLGVDGPAVQGGEASTAGHPNQQRDEIRALLATADDILRDTLQDIVTRMSTIVREATAVVELVQQLDPTPIGLVRASKVTDINSKRSR